MKKTPLVKDVPEVSLPISKIKPSSYNPRRDLGPEDRQLIEIERSLKEFGIVVPLVWNKKTGNLVAGHQRLKVLKGMGVQKVRVRVVDVPAAREKVLNVAINRLGSSPDMWDEKKLFAVLTEINATAGELEIAGFSEDELASLKEIEDAAPTTFATVGADVATDHKCPKCGFEYAGDCKLKKPGEPKA